MYRVILSFLLTTGMAFIVTEIVRIMAFKIGAVDHPNSRRINKEIMPTSGGLAIYIVYFISVIFILPLDNSLTIPLFLGASIIVFTGLIDDIKSISPKMKIFGIVSATLVVYYLGDISMSTIDIPFIGLIELGYFSLPLTILWVTSITNAINLIDGLDGLATGVSSISLTTIGIVAYSFLETNNVEITIMIFTLVAALIGFLPANYFPAKIYLGDTGALFLGFMISVFSLFNLKNVTFISLVIPLVILAIPIADTLYAIVRRKVNKQPISTADKHHIHHRLMALGFNHKQSVKLLYLIAIVFSIVALIFPIANTTGIILLTISLLVSLQFLAEIIGLVGTNNKPLIMFIKNLLKIVNKKYES